MGNLPRYLLLAACLCALSSPALSTSQPQVTDASSTLFEQDKVAVRLGAENSWPPYSNQYGQGISTELIKSAFDKVGVVPSFHVLPYARVLHDLGSGKLDGGFNVTRQSTTEKKYLFGEVPLLRVRAYWFFLAGSHSEIKSLEDLPDNFRVGVIRDYEYGDHYETQRHRFNEIELSQQSQIIRMLKQGRIDAGLMYEREAEYTLKEMQLSATQFDKRFLNHEGDVYLAFSRKSPRAHWIAQQLDKGLMELKRTGEYEKIAHPEEHTH